MLLFEFLHVRSGVWGSIEYKLVDTGRFFSILIIGHEDLYTIFPYLSPVRLSTGVNVTPYIDAEHRLISNKLQRYDGTSF